jgi:hypothetical protein
MKTFWGMEVYFLAFLTSAPGGVKYLSSHPGGKSPRHPLCRRLGGPHSRSGRGGEEKKSLHLPEIESLSSSP